MLFHSSRMSHLSLLLSAFLLLFCSSAAFSQDATPQSATAPCGGDFGAWLQTFKTEAAAQGISQRAIQAGLTGVTSAR